jgi:excisionase family DNA binding protein
MSELMKATFQGGYISIEEAAVLSGMSVSWWRTAVANRRVPFYRCGRRILLRREDIEQMFRKNRVEPTAQAELSAATA